jgi:plasmid stabilization system protein ParE
MIVTYTQTALGEIEQIVAYIAKSNPSAATHVVAQIEQMIARLGELKAQRAFISAINPEPAE